MNDLIIKVFFYGSFMNIDVLSEHGFTAQKTEIALLRGYELFIRPYANLIKSPQGIVYGVLATGKQKEILSLYADTKGTFGFSYLPEAVIVETLDNYISPALCYICPELPQAMPSKEYLDKMIGTVENLDFPDWYIDKIKSFKSDKSQIS